MNSVKKAERVLDDVKINIKFKLAALWTAVMFLYIYADIESFFYPGNIGKIMTGEMGGIQINSGFLLATAVLMTIPSVMIFLSLVLKSRVNRWVNVILGIIYSLVIIMTNFMPAEKVAYYVFYNVVEIVLTVLIVVFALRWPEEKV